MRLEYDGCEAVVEYDAQLKRYTGHVLNVPDGEIYFGGETLDEARRSLARAVDQHRGVKP